MITNNNYNVNLASLSDKKFLYDFAKKVNFDVKAPGRKSTRSLTLLKLLKSPAIMASGVLTVFSSSDPSELCDRLKLLLQEKHAGNNSNIFNDQIVAIVDEFLEYNCISKKQHKQLLSKGNLSQKISIITHLFLCIHKHKYSYECMPNYNHSYKYKHT